MGKGLRILLLPDAAAEKARLGTHVRETKDGRFSFAPFTSVVMLSFPVHLSN